MRGVAVMYKRLAPVDVFVIMHPDEMAFVAILEGCPGGTVCLIADNQIKSGQVVFTLGLVQYFNGMVGREHHAHVGIVMALGHLCCKA